MTHSTMFDMMDKQYLITVLLGIYSLFVVFLQVKSVFNMTAKEGRKRSISCLVAVGNGNGAAGLTKTH